MNYNYDNQLMVLDIPNHNRIIFNRNDLVRIKEDFRNTNHTECHLVFRDGKTYSYCVTMDDIIDNLKPLL